MRAFVCTLWLILSVCISAVCVCLQAHVFVRMFVLLKGLAQSRPFVVGSSGHSAQLVWFMDVSQNCISLRPEKKTAHLPGVKPTNVPTLTALNRNWYKHQIRLTHISCCQSINSYINTTQKEAGKQMKYQHGKTSLWGWFHATAASDISRVWKFNCKMFKSEGGQSSAQSIQYI